MTLTAIALVLWILAVLATWAGVVLAVLAGRSRWRWLVLPAVLPVVAAILVGLFGGMPDAPVDALAVLTAMGLALIGVIAGSPIVSLVLRLAGETSPPGTHGGILVRDESSPPPARREVLRGGATIGYLERLAMIGSVLAGQAAALAVIVAIKGLGRFSELEDEAARERFIIGTLASLTWAGICAASVLLWW